MQRPVFAYLYDSIKLAHFIKRILSVGACSGTGCVGFTTTIRPFTLATLPACWWVWHICKANTLLGPMRVCVLGRLQQLVHAHPFKFTKHWWTCGAYVVWQVVKLSRVLANVNQHAGVYCAANVPQRLP